MSLYDFNNLSNIPVKYFPNLVTNNSFQVTKPVDYNVMYYPYTYNNLSGPLGYQMMSQYSFSKSKLKRNNKLKQHKKKYLHKSKNKSKKN